ncbi:MAG: hypothetical protein ABF651_09870 [Sporolactobacillus sp.]
MIHRKKTRKMIGFILGGLILLLLFFLLLLSLADGVFQSAHYLAPWNSDYVSSASDPRIRLVAKAELAASGHNMQPWRIKLDHEETQSFYLYADPKRLTLQVDPFARQTMISQGTFLEYLSVAGAHAGYDVRIRLFPKGAYNEHQLKKSMAVRPVAKITLTKGITPGSKWYPYLFQPDTNRGPYALAKLTSEQLSQLRGLIHDPDLSLTFYQDTRNLKRLNAFANEGARIESSVKRISDESAAVFRANEYQKNAKSYGYSFEGQGMSGIKMQLFQGLITLFPALNNDQAASSIFVNSTKSATTHTPAYAILKTKGNSRIDQVKAGMIYSRLVLEAHRLGLSLQPPSQVLEEYPEMSRPYHQIHSDYAQPGETIQMFVRIGRPLEPAQKSMRQDVHKFLIK